MAAEHVGWHEGLSMHPVSQVRIPTLDVREAVPGVTRYAWGHRPLTKDPVFGCFTVTLPARAAHLPGV